MRDHQHPGAHAPGLAEPERARVPAAGLAPLGAPGAAAAGVAQKDETRCVLGSGAAGFRGQGTADDADSPASGYSMQPDAERKELARVTALAAFAGCALHELAGGGFLLCRWNLSRELPDLRAVSALLRRMGAQA